MAVDPNKPDTPSFCADAPPSTADWLEVIRIGKNDWRVSDTRRAAGDSARLLGFIERIHRDRFEVLWMTMPLRWAYLPSMTAAIEAFGDSLRFTGEQLPARQELHPRRTGPTRWDPLT